MSARARRNGVLAAAVLGACVGPPAPDAALCEDVVARMCVPCPELRARLAITSDCEATLRARTGCDQADFAFEPIGRDRLLQCRRALRGGADEACAAASRALDGCPDLEAFLSEERS
jgi:hypothetical protein